MSSKTKGQSDFEQALDLAEDALDNLETKHGEIGSLATIAMIDVAVQRALEHLEPKQVVEMLKGLTGQLLAEAA
jgi:hypothetical protein